MLLFLNFLTYSIFEIFFLFFFPLLELETFASFWPLAVLLCIFVFEGKYL